MFSPPKEKAIKMLKKHPLPPQAPRRPPNLSMSPRALHRKGGPDSP